MASQSQSPTSRYQQMIHSEYSSGISLRTMEQFQSVKSSHGVRLSFSRVTYAQIAQRVGLNPDVGGDDFAQFELGGVPIPEADFLSIIREFECILRQYGGPDDHPNEETRARVTAATFNQIVSWFDNLIRNTPKVLMDGRLSRSGQIKNQFRSCRLCTIAFIEFKAVLGTHVAEHRKNAIAQVIMEADACSLSNERNNLDNPIYAILSDGIDFHFFRFTPRSAKTSSAEQPLLTIARGYHMSLPQTTAVLATQPPARTYFHLPNVSCTDPSRFLSQLRLLCETIFWVFLAGYTASLEAYLTRSRIQEKDNVERWDTALDKAKNAMAAGILNGGNVSMEQEDKAATLRILLNASLDAVPSAYRGYHRKDLVEIYMKSMDVKS
ncbi:hypothetical protein BDZ91DRAFT_834919 [Kalaharituber pfeilii]|nr:hypothetical protein BDZ91DRAFT_834919 [Kalaharituber pfeilii]